MNLRCKVWAGILTLFWIATLGLIADPVAQLEANRQRWANMTEAQREAVREAARNLDQQRLSELKQRMKRFHELPEEERQRIHKNHKKFKQLAPDERHDRRKKLARFKELPERRKEAIRNKQRPGGKPSREVMREIYDTNDDGILTGDERQNLRTERKPKGPHPKPKAKEKSK